MKVIRVSNYDYEDWRGNQHSMTRSGLSHSVAELVCACLNENPQRNDGDYYRVVGDEYELYQFQP